MKKNILLIIPVLMISLTGCSKAQTSEESKNESNQITAVQENNNISKDDNLYLDKESFKKDYKQFTLDDTALYSSIFQDNESSIVFPNWDDSNNISIINEPFEKGVINTSSISDFVAYPTYSLSVINNIVYFSEATKNGCLSSINLSDKSYNVILPKDKVSNIIAEKHMIYFINNSKENRLQAYDTDEKESKMICGDNVGTYLVDNNIILYENKSDKSTLYKIKTDGTERQKLTDFSVDSFAPYENKIITINSSDNNNLYSINLEDLSTQRLAIMNGEKLKKVNGELYFIDVDNSRHLSTMKLDFSSTPNPIVSFTDLSKETINEYYLTDKGIFIQRSSDVNQGYILLKQ